MKITFKTILPKETNRIKIDLPENLSKKIDDKSAQKVNVSINGKKYLCHLYKKNNELFSLQLSSTTLKVIEKDSGLGKELTFTIENYENPSTDMHKIVMDWETTKAVKLMKKIGVKKNNIIIDFACGYGHYSLPCAFALNNTGKVYAIDKDKKSLDWINKKCKIYSLENIETLKTKGIWKIDFPNNNADIILLYDIIHAKDIQTKDFVRFTLYKESQRVLKKGGILSVLTFDSEIKKISSKKNKDLQIIYQDMVTEIQETGFKFSHIVDDGVHFDYYHSSYHINKGVEFSKLEKGNIYNFKKI